jgi:isochorismate hydrolase
MAELKTLLELAGADLRPAKIRDAVLVLIDYQNEYLARPLALPDAARAIARAGRLLSIARDSGTPIIHVAHKGRPGGLFDRAAERGQIVTALVPWSGETVIEKSLPNAFAGKDLHDVAGKSTRKDIIIAGFMTHMCVSWTARAPSISAIVSRSTQALARPVICRTGRAAASKPKSCTRSLSSNCRIVSRSLRTAPRSLPNR